jgi:hypothetical protein
MNADPQHDTPDPQPPADQQREPSRSPFDAAWETWNDWSMANTMRNALQVARERNDC